MKKLCLILAMCLLVALTGCKAEYVRIDSYTWEVVSVDVMDEANQTSECIACSPVYAKGFGLAGLVKEMDLKIAAKDGKITFTDSTNGVTYEGTYGQISQTGNPTAFEKRTSYELRFDGSSGIATTRNETFSVGVPGGKDAVWAGEGTPVLQIVVGRYSLYCVREGFLAEKFSQYS